MSETGIERLGMQYASTWDLHYNTPEGQQKVAARRALYDCLEDGVESVNFDTEVIDSLRYAGLSSTATIMDIGCSYPAFLELWQITGHKGQLIGIEPNTAQFNGLPYWQPIDPEASVRPGIDQSAKFYELYGGDNSELSGITLYRAHANFIPVDARTVDMAAFMFSFYHVPKDRQPAALDEVKRVLKMPDGVLALATSGNDNKEGIRHNEVKLAKALSRIAGTMVFAPEPLNSGFTTENAVDLLPTRFRHVYMFEHKAKIVVNDRFSSMILLGGYRSLRDKYHDETGAYPSQGHFEIALKEVVGQQLGSAFEAGQAVEDTLSQALFLASDAPLRVPAKYQEL